MQKLFTKSGFIVVGLLGLTAYHLATQNYSMALNDVLTVVAATHYAPVLALLAGLGVHIPADPLAPVVVNPAAPAALPPAAGPAPVVAPAPVVPAPLAPLVPPPADPVHSTF